MYGKREMAAIMLSTLMTLTVGANQASAFKANETKVEKKRELSRSIASVKKFTSKEQLVVGETYFITTNGLNVRKDASFKAGSIIGKLKRNDQVKILNTVVEGSRVLVQVEIVKTSMTIKRSAQYLLSYQFLTKEKIDYKNFQGKYFVIQNVATETLRVYEKECENLNCPNKMILEAELAVGEDDDEVRTWLGSYRLSTWVKFYEDNKGLYPSWYHPSYPMPPTVKKKPGRGALRWFKNKYMPRVNGKREGSMRGAFGWYTAHMEPDSNAQWTHGTIGWGFDKTSFIKRTKKWTTNLVSNPRSHGCSRTDNETIAYLREILPVGTPFIKIYAFEKLLDPTLSSYNYKTLNWDYILTKRDARKYGGQTADRDKVIASNLKLHEVLEEGTYRRDTYPTVINFRTTKVKTKRGNTYDLPSELMNGVYYIDAGVLSRYAHPRHEKIVVGGHKDEVVPVFMDYGKANF
jgi:hypothetical protein